MRFHLPARIAVAALSSALLLLLAASCGVLDTAPIADAGPDLSTNVGLSVTLDGSASSDADGDPLAFAWNLRGRPAGSSATLSSADTATPSFVPDVQGSYEATLVVTAAGATNSDTVTVTVSDDPPVLAAIEDQRVAQAESLDVPFQVQDERPELVTVTATSSEPTLVSNTGLEVLGSGTDRTVRVTPEPTGLGTVEITLIATDAGTNAASATFVVRVEPPFQTPAQKLTASDAAENDGFGRSVAIDGRYAIVGAPGDDDAGDASGAAYLYRRDGGAWNETQRLTASDAQAGDQFGFSVAIDGDHIAVGALRDDDGGEDAGSAYVFRRDGDTWTQVDKLIASDAQAAEEFGSSVSLDGDSVIVGAPFDTHSGASNAGSAYVFRHDGDTWNETHKLTASDAAPQDWFGFSVAIDGIYAIVGSWLDDDDGSGSGSAYVFRRNGDTWSETQKLAASDADADDWFGVSVAIDGDRAIVGAFGDDDGGEDAGAAYVFRRDGDVWSEAQKLGASDADVRDEFGVSVAIDGTYAIVGAWIDDDDGTSSGSAYVYRRSGAAWSETLKLTASDADAGDRFGGSVAIEGDHALVGARFDDDDGTDSGSAYVYLK